MKEKVSKTKIEKRLQKKKTPRLRTILIKLKKQNESFWLSLARDLAKPRKKAINVNLYKIDKYSKPNETIIVPGKVLSVGKLKKQIKIAALSFSKAARDKIKLSGSKIVEIKDLIKKPDKNMKIIK